MSWLCLNGDLVQAEEARLRVDDRGLLLGDGLFETMRSYQGAVFRRDDHLARLFRSAIELNLVFPWSGKDLSSLVDSLLDRNRLAAARVRLTITRGRHLGAMSLPPASSPTLIITADSIPDHLQDPEKKGVTLITAGVRFSENNPVFRHKTLNRLPHLLARTEAERKGANEALILDERGNVAACSTGNLFVFHKNQLFTPPLTGPILPGVTRGVVLELAREAGIPIREDFFSPIVLAGANEAFMTNSVQEIVSVLKVDDQLVGSGRPGAVAAGLIRRYRELAEG